MKTSQNFTGAYDPMAGTLGSNARSGAFQDEPFPPSGKLEHGMPIVPNAPGAVPAQAASAADTLQCLDLDNDHRIVLDSLKDVAFQDDAWMREISARRAEQDELGAQLVAVVASLAVEQSQTDLFGAVAQESQE